MMKYYVYDEDGLMIRCFQHKYEALAFVQTGWTIKFIKMEKKNGYEVAKHIGDARF